MSLKYGLLGLLNYSDMTGYELARAFKDSLSYFWQAQTSQIYRELNKMEEQAFLTSRIEVQTDKPNKRIYSITESGKDQLRIWLDSKLPDELMPTRSEVLMRVFFSSGKSTAENIASFRHIRDVYQEHLKQLDAVNGIIDGYREYANTGKDALYWELTADFGRAYSKMCIEWAEKCIERLEGQKE